MAPQPRMIILILSISWPKNKLQLVLTSEAKAVILHLAFFLSFDSVPQLPISQYTNQFIPMFC